MVKQVEILLPAYSRGFHLITNHIQEFLPDLPDKGILHLFIQHTSAGLTINENADPTVKTDLENVFDNLVPDGSGIYIHSLEGPDDMPAHVKASLVGHSVSLPIVGGGMNLGTWQGVYLCEFRNHGGRRKIVATIIS
jgi:secondary thiamine-phosphate synthase enzyme